MPSFPATLKAGPAVPETEFLHRAAGGPARWEAQPLYLYPEAVPQRLPLGREHKAGCLTAHPADGRHRAVLAPVDPVALLLRHRADVERLRIGMGSRRLFETRIMPMLIGWAAMVQSFPRDERGLWSGTDGLFEAGLAFAAGALAAADARVLEPDMPPAERAEWTDRVRAAAVASGLLSDVRRLAALDLKAGIENPSDGRFTPLETFNPGEETALAFCVRHAGRVMRLERRTPEQTADRLPAASADVLRLVVPDSVLRWLGSAERSNGETVLSALKSALVYTTGSTETERLLAEAAARGREWAVNRRAAAAARREGKSPLLQGFAEVYECEVARRVFSGLWPLNTSSSPIVWADDGIALRWPEAFTLIAEEADDAWLFRHIPDEAPAAAEILLSANLLIPSETGSPVWQSLSADGTPDGRTWLRLLDGQKFVSLARRAADRVGSVLPHRDPPLFRKRRTEAAPEGTPGWDTALPAGVETTDVGKCVACAVQELDRVGAVKRFMTDAGLFIPESLLPDHFGEIPGGEKVFVMKALSGLPLVRSVRLTARRRILVKPAHAAFAAAFTLTRETDSRFEADAGLVLEGAILNRHVLRPVIRWPDGSVTEREWPELTDAIEVIDDDETVRRIGRELLQRPPQRVAVDRPPAMPPAQTDDDDDPLMPARSRSTAGSRERTPMSEDDEDPEDRTETVKSAGMSQQDCDGDLDF